MHRFKEKENRRLFWLNSADAVQFVTGLSSDGVTVFYWHKTQDLRFAK